ncbi:hypothetical protein [Streptomyces abikoensis]|uniref:hypothetical protein n=1 Tax=Streptomyces abikoensis TaxID=97398 RepID=UPI0019B6D9A9|nr:hypothetical protein [Streptomyces abikoensis]GGP33809.1 hypothetical protein GCM10010214_02320 [Streptomyces abikoensis]
MGNVFGSGNSSGSTDDDLYLSNGGTAAFLDVLWLAVSDLARRPWDFRFAALLALQDQSVMGRGVVGFGLEDIDWGGTPDERARNKDFVLRVIDLALERRRWDELDYEPPYVPGYLRRYRAAVVAFIPPPRPADEKVFPAPDMALTASCVRHRVLDALPHWAGCVFCTGGTMRSPADRAGEEPTAMAQPLGGGSPAQ